MRRFTLRDLFWWTFVVALLVAFWLEWTKWRESARRKPFPHNVRQPTQPANP